MPWLMCCNFTHSEHKPRNGSLASEQLVLQCSLAIVECHCTRFARSQKLKQGRVLDIPTPLSSRADSRLSLKAFQHDLANGSAAFNIGVGAFKVRGINLPVIFTQCALDHASIDQLGDLV